MRHERVAGNALAVDIDVVGAVLVNNAVCIAGAFQVCVIARHLRVVQHDRVAGAPSDGDQRRTQWNRCNIGHGQACDAAAVMIGQCDQRAVLVPDAEYVPIA